MRTIRFYFVFALHRVGIHRLCKRVFTPDPRPDPWAFLRDPEWLAEHDVTSLYGGRPPIETHTP